MSKVSQIIRETITELIDDSGLRKVGQVEQPKVVGTDMVQTDKNSVNVVVEKKVVLTPLV